MQEQVRVLFIGAGKRYSSAARAPSIQLRIPVMSDSSTSAQAKKRPVSRLALPMQDEDVAALRRAVVAKLTYSVGKDPNGASDRDWFVATALAVRDRIVDRWMTSTRPTYAE